MTSPSVTVLDVGHGNCSVVIDGEGEGEVVVVIDTPKRNHELADTLRAKRVHRVDYVLISHGDEDHVGGLVGLLGNSDVHVGRVFLNSEVDRDTALWQDLRVAVRDAMRRAKSSAVDEVRVTPCLTTDTSHDLKLPSLCVEVLAPPVENAISGAGGRTLDGDKLEANTMSAVVRVSDDNSRGVLITGDLDMVGLGEVDPEADLSADVLVFPHHGGRPGKGEPQKFARQLAARVAPDSVLFSLSRTKTNGPRPEIIAGVREACPQAHVACTQLSKNCAEAIPGAAQDYLSVLPASGRTDGCCCAGTMELRFEADGLHAVQRSGHSDFVSDHVPDALCLGPAPAPV